MPLISPRINVVPVAFAFAIPVEVIAATAGALETHANVGKVAGRTIFVGSSGAEGNRSSRADDRATWRNP